MTDRNYVAAWMDYKADKVIVLERDQQGALHRKAFNPPYYFYIPDEEGEYTSLYGDKLMKAEFDSKQMYDEAKRQFDKKFESDIQPLKRLLMDRYYNVPRPIVNYAFLDIEVDYQQAIGFAGPSNPYGIINAITIYQSWTKKFLTYAVAPEEYEGDTQQLLDRINQLVAEKQLREGYIPEITICRDEYELLTRMLNDIQEADIISGWNSEFYDIPYICERLLLAGGERLLSRMEHLGVPLPRKEMVNHFGSEEPIYKFAGRSHLDYQKLFMKFTFEGRVSYALGNILQEEVGVGKLEHGHASLERLYHDDFPTFVAYNFRDVDGLVQLDEKFKFIALANQMSHENTVLFDAVLGTVAYVETGITNHAHNKFNKIVMDKKISEHDKVEGAIVLTPRKGLHKFGGAVDIRSLYPNVIRSLNMSPEKIVGQFYNKEQAFKDILAKNDVPHTLRLETGSEHTATAAEWSDALVLNLWAISGYGTVFDQSSGNGIVADILQYWYSERKRLQAEKKKWDKIAKELSDGPEKDHALKQSEDFDLLQLTKKISMNSLYGALLNAAFRFGDERMGASVTSTGRHITAHMLQTVGYLATGNEVKIDKKTTTLKNGKIENIYTTDCDAVIYSDTDSCYFKTYAENKEDAIVAADLICDGLNATFQPLMKNAFKCNPGFDKLIEASREIVFSNGIFLAKKKYVVKVVDLEGFAVNKLKAQGSEIKKADTPKIIQNFLKQTVDMILDDVEYDEICTYVNSQRKAILKNKDLIFHLGVAKQVNELDKFTAEYNAPGSMRSKSGGKLTITGHARATCNYNTLLDHFDKGAKRIRSGDKVLVYSLKPNEFGFKTIAMPAESTRFPAWFLENFSIDIKTTEQKMFDSKLGGIFTAIGKDIPSPQSVLTNSILNF